LPNVALEAMACGVPVVGSSVGGIPEIIADGANGYLVRPGDPKALAGRINDLLAAEAPRREFGRRSRERMMTEFTFAAQSARYEELFDVLVQKRLWYGERTGAQAKCRLGA
jgi:glycosyltransferase involved in cell wall biosynthesis